MQPISKEEEIMMELRYVISSYYHLYSVALLKASGKLTKNEKDLLKKIQLLNNNLKKIEGKIHIITGINYDILMKKLKQNQMERNSKKHKN